MLTEIESPAPVIRKRASRLCAITSHPKASHDTGNTTPATRTFSPQGVSVPGTYLTSRWNGLSVLIKSTITTTAPTDLLLPETAQAAGGLWRGFSDQRARRDSPLHFPSDEKRQWRPAQC